MKTVIKNHYTQNVIVESELNMKEAVVANKVSLCGADLCGADLRSADLCGADLRDASLRGANLRDADLCGASLCGADLRDAEIKATQKETIIDSIGLIIEK